MPSVAVGTAHAQPAPITAQAVQAPQPPMHALLTQQASITSAHHYSFLFSHLSKQPVLVRVQKAAFNKATQFMLDLFGADSIAPLIEQITAQAFCECYRAGAYLLEIDCNLQVSLVYDLAYASQALYGGRIIQAARAQYGEGADVWLLLSRLMPEVRIQVNNGAPAGDSVRVVFEVRETSYDIMGVTLVEQVPMLVVMNGKGLSKVQTEYVLLRAFLHAVLHGWAGQVQVSLVRFEVDSSAIDAAEWVRANVLAYYKPDSWALLLDLAKQVVRAGGGVGVASQDDSAVRLLADRIGAPAFVLRELF